MESSRIGATLAAARARLGWSREALAFHSGVSWSAIAQIESGRRKDVRLSSLSALADALGMSVDSLIGTVAATTPPRLLEHRVLAYGSDEEYLSGVLPFLAERSAAADCLLAVTTAAQRVLLQEALGDRCSQIEFADSADWYRSPSAALDRYRGFVTEKVDGGATWIRIVGEADWALGSDAESAAWSRYESMINLVFASSPVTVMCSYDRRSLPARLLADAPVTHPELAHGDDMTLSPMYREPEDFLLAGDRLS